MVSGPYIEVIRCLSFVYFKIAIQFLLRAALMVGQILNSMAVL